MLREGLNLVTFSFRNKRVPNFLILFIFNKHVNGALLAVQESSTRESMTCEQGNFFHLGGDGSMTGLSADFPRSIPGSDDVCPFLH